MDDGEIPSGSAAPQVLLCGVVEDEADADNFIAEDERRTSHGKPEINDIDQKSAMPDTILTTTTGTVTDHLKDSKDIPSPINIDHPSTSSRQSTIGHEYENYISVLCFLDLYEKYNDIAEKHFRACVGAEIEDVAIFEDVVYAQVQRGEASVCCVQAKYSEQRKPITLYELFSDNHKKICLLSYFKYHRKIKKNMKDFNWYKKIQESFGYAPVSHKFIVFTNRPLQNEEHLSLQPVTGDILFQTSNMRQESDETKEIAKHIVRNEVTRFINEIDFECERMDTHTCRKLMNRLKKGLQEASVPGTKAIIAELTEKLSILFQHKNQHVTEDEKILPTQQDGTSKLTYKQMLKCKITGLIEEVIEECLMKNKQQCKWYQVKATFKKDSLFQKTLEKIKDVAVQEIKQFFNEYAFSLIELNTNKFKKGIEEKIQNTMHLADTKLVVDLLAERLIEISALIKNQNDGGAPEQDKPILFHKCAEYNNVLYCIPESSSQQIIYQNAMKQLENPIKRKIIANILEDISFGDSPSKKSKKALRKKIQKQGFEKVSELTDEIIKWAYKEENYPQCASKGLKFFVSSQREHKLCKIIISTAPESVYQNIIKKINEDIENQVDFFFNEFFFAVDQPNVRELKLLIEKKLRKFTGVDIVEHMASILASRVREWSMDTKGKLTNEHAHKCFSYIKECITSFAQVDQTAATLEKINKLGIKFNEETEVVLKLNQILKDRNRTQQTFLLYYEHLMLTKMKIAQAIQGTGTAKKTIFANAKDIKYNNLNPILNYLLAFQGNQCDILIITLENKDELNDIVTSKNYSDISKFIQNKMHKIVIFIAPLIFRNEVKRQNEYTILEDKENYFFNLDMESQEKISSESALIFQGQKLSLQSIIDNDLKKKISGGALLKLIKKEDILLSDTPKDSNYENVKNYYIDRKLYRLVEFHKNVFSELCYKDEFHIINSNSNNYLESKDIGNKDLILITERNNSNDDSQEFSNLCRLYTGFNIHWFINLDGCRLRLKKSVGSAKKILKNLVFTSYKYDYDGNNYTRCKNEIFSSSLDIEEIEERLVIVVAEPGMGKSTLLSHLAERIKSSLEYCSSNSLCVVKTNLVDHCKLFSKATERKETTKTDVLRFLIKAMNLELQCSSFFEEEEELFKQVVEEESGEITLKLQNSNFSYRDILCLKLFCYIYNKKKLIVLLDGIDEIAPDYEKHVLDMLCILKNSTVHKVWVTTRPFSIVRQLERKLDTLSFALTPFTEKQQELFLNMFLNEGDTVIDKDKFNDFLDQFKEQLFHRKVYKPSHFKNENTDLSTFMCTPLHITMIATMYQEYIRFEKKTESHIVLTVYDLFTKFFEIKYDIENRGSDTTIPYKRNQDRKLKMCQRSMLGKLALSNLLSDWPHFYPISSHPVSKIISYSERQKLVEYVFFRDEKTGIIFTEENPCIFTFVHRTFAEYFAADLLAEMIINDERNFEVVRDILYEIYASQGKYNMILMFFNYGIIARSNIINQNYRNILNAAVKGDVRKLMEYENVTDIKDDLARTPLHLSCFCGNNDVIIMLLEKYRDLMCVQDKLFGWTPLNYAIKASKTVNLDLNYFKNIPDITSCNFDLNLKDFKGNTAIYHAVHETNEYLTYFLLKNGCNVSIKDLDGVFCTPYLIKWLDHSLLFCFENGIDCSPYKILLSPMVQRDDFLIRVMGEHRSLSSCLLKCNILGVNQQDLKGKTALHYAAKNGDVEIMEYLLKQGADENIKDSNGYTFQEILFNKDKFKSGMDRFNRCLETNEGNDLCSKLMHYLAQNKSVAIYFMSQYVNVASYLLKHKMIDVNAQDEKSRTALHHLAERYSTPEVIYVLLEDGADVYIKDNDGKIPAQIFIESIYKESNFGNLNNDIQYKRGELILPFLISLVQFIENVAYIAGRYQYVGLFLLKHNLININNEDTEGQVVLQHAFNTNASESYIISLIKYEAKFDLVSDAILHTDNVMMCIVQLFESVKTESTAKLNSLLKEDISKHLINTRSKEFGKMLIHFAAEKGNKDIVKLLLSLGAFYNVPDDNGRTPISLTVEPEVRKLLDITDKLFAAVKSGRINDVESLIFAGAVVHAREYDSDGLQPLHLAVEGRHYSVADILLKNGADKYFKTQKDQTLFHIAYKSDYEEKIEYLSKIFTVKEVIKMTHACKDLHGVIPFEIAAAKGNDLNSNSFLLSKVLYELVFG